MHDVALRIIADDDERESMGSEIQVCIVHGDGNWPGFRSLRLFDEEVFPVCSPEYDFNPAADNWVDWLLQAQLIDLADSQWNWMNWRLWLSGNDIDRPLANRHLQINSYPLVIEAACAGLGVALGWRYLVDDLVSRGRLTRPIPQSLTTEFGYYLAWRDSLDKDPALVRFRDWLSQAFGEGDE